MPRRVTLTDRQREALLHLPVDQGELLRHYTLSDEDLGISASAGAPTIVLASRCNCASCATRAGCSLLAS
jgi:hypothetical protein